MAKKNTKDYSGHEKMSCKALGHTDDYETEATSLVRSLRVRRVTPDPSSTNRRRKRRSQTSYLSWNFRDVLFSFPFSLWPFAPGVVCGEPVFGEASKQRPSNYSPHKTVHQRLQQFLRGSKQEDWEYPTGNEEATWRTSRRCENFEK